MRGASLLVLLVGAAAAQGQVDIRMDLATSAGTTPGNWNNISNLTGLTPNLVNFLGGGVTGVSINGGGSPWQPFFGDDTGAFPNQDWLIQPATRDGAGLQAGLTGVFTIGGLTGSAYRVELVSARSTFNYLNTFTVGGVIADSTFKGTPVVTPWNSTTDGLANGNWLIWSNVIPSGGTIQITDVSGPGTLGILNAIRVVEIPAPGASLGLVVAAGVLTRRRTRG